MVTFPKTVAVSAVEIIFTANALLKPPEDKHHTGVKETLHRQVDIYEAGIRRYKEYHE